jgi:septum formation protein
MLYKLTEKYQIILASGSPRRQQFLKDLGLDFKIRLKDIPEVYPLTLEAEEIPIYLSKLKASAFSDLTANELLITSDTIVWHDKQALGKPKDAQDAFEMLMKLQNSTHKVITAVTFKTQTWEKTIFDVTNVTFGVLPENFIWQYINNAKPFDKAGSYGIQEWIGLVGIIKIEGSYTNVVGLPTQKVFEFLNALVP